MDTGCEKEEQAKAKSLPTRETSRKVRAWCAMGTEDLGPIFVSETSIR